MLPVFYSSFFKISLKKVRKGQIYQLMLLKTQPFHSFANYENRNTKNKKGHLIIEIRLKKWNNYLPQHFSTNSILPNTDWNNLNKKIIFKKYLQLPRSNSCVSFFIWVS